MTPKAIAVGVALSVVWLLGHWLGCRRAERREDAAMAAYWAHNATIPVEQRLGLYPANLGVKSASTSSSTGWDSHESPRLSPVGELMPIRYRPHRELLDDAMAEARTFEVPSDFVDYVRREQQIEVTAVKPYGFDHRIGWDTHIVIGRHRDGHESPVGWTDGPVDVEALKP